MKIGRRSQTLCIVLTNSVRPTGSRSARPSPQTSRRCSCPAAIGTMSLRPSRSTLMTASDFAHPLMKSGRPAQPLRTTLTESLLLSVLRSVRPPLVTFLDCLRLCSDWWTEITAASQPRSWYLLAVSDFVHRLMKTGRPSQTLRRTFTNSVPTLPRSARPAPGSAGLVP